MLQTKGFCSKDNYINDWHRAVALYCGVYALVAVVLTALLLLINKTRFGLHVRAVACAGKTAGLLGIRIDRVIAMVFMLATLTTLELRFVENFTKAHLLCSWASYSLFADG